MIRERGSLNGKFEPIYILSNVKRFYWFSTYEYDETVWICVRVFGGWVGVQFAETKALLCRHKYLSKWRANVGLCDLFYDAMNRDRREE